MVCEHGGAIIGGSSLTLTQHQEIAAQNPSFKWSGSMKKQCLATKNQQLATVSDKDSKRRQIA